MPKTKAKTQRHLPRRGFASAPIQTPRVIAKDISRSVRCLGVNTDEYVESHRRMWEKDYPNRRCAYFSEEKMYAHKDAELEVIPVSEFRKVNRSHSVEQIVFAAKQGEWMLKVMRESSGRLHWDFAVYNGDGWTFHPDESRNKILAHHSQEVYDRWRRHVRASFDVAAPQLIAACKEAFPTLRAWSVTSCDRSDRLMRSLDDVVVINRIAYLVW